MHPPKTRAKLGGEASVGPVTSELPRSGDSLRSATKSKRSCPCISVNITILVTQQRLQISYMQKDSPERTNTEYTKGTTRIYKSNTERKINTTAHYTLLEAQSNTTEREDTIRLGMDSPQQQLGHSLQHPLRQTPARSHRLVASRFGRGPEAAAETDGPAEG